MRDQCYHDALIEARRQYAAAIQERDRLHTQMAELDKEICRTVMLVESLSALLSEPIDAQTQAAITAWQERPKLKLPKVRKARKSA